MTQSDEHSSTVLSPPSIVRPEGKPKRTHANERVVALLKGLDLTALLTRNRKIEERNRKRAEKRVDFALSPLDAVDASDDESYITIDEKHLKTLETRGMLEKLSHCVPDWIHEKLSAVLQAKKDAEEKLKEERLEKRKADEDEDKAETKAAKLRKMRYHNPSAPTSSHYSEAQEVEHPFPDMLHYTATHCRLPIDIFKNSNLKLLNQKLSSLPQTKLADTQLVVLNLAPSKLAPYGIVVSDTEPVDPNPHEWREIHRNHHRFQSERDAPDTDPENSRFWSSHYAWIDRAANPKDNWEAIVATELRMRTERLDTNEVFDEAEYKSTLLRKIDALAERKRRDREREDESRKRWGGRSNGGGSYGGGYGGGYSGGGTYGWNGDGPSTGAVGGRPNGGFAGRGSGGGGYADRKQPFQASSSGSSSSWRCVICSGRGHSAQFHSDKDPSHPKALPSGNPFASHLGNNGKSVFSKAGDELCINWNLYGDGDRCKDGHDKRKHACSFCGSAKHWAFSWTCEKKPKGGD